jgi:O-antigen ligase
VTWPGAQPERRTHESARSAQFAIAGAAIAGVVAYALATQHRVAAIAASLAPIVAWVLTRPVVLLVPLGLAIPDVRSLTEGRAGFEVSISDALLVLAGAGILVEAAMTKSFPAVRALRPLLLPVVPYSVVMGLLLFLHFSSSSLAQTGQRFELFLLPLVVGAYAAVKGKHIRLLQAYIVASTVLAILWPLQDFGMQKNPVGQMIANAILLLVAVQRLRALLPLLLILVPGLFLTQSRGALVAAAIGVGVIVAIHGLGQRSLTRGVALAVLAAGVFALMPSALQERVTTLSASQETRAGYAIFFREEYSKDAKRIIAEHRWTGVGIGNYAEASRFSPFRVEDPHQVILLQAAEGGYVLAVSFVLLVAGAVFAMLRMRRIEVGVAAAAVLLATVAHGMVDVYWVRGTPVLGWLLVGMACGARYALRQTPEHAAA